MNDSKMKPLFMVAQLPFNTTETRELNAYMTKLMDDSSNININLSNLKELGVYEDLLSGKFDFLEIGCGRGYLLCHLYENRLNKEETYPYYGIEPIASEYAIAVNKLNSLIKKNEKILSNEIFEKVDFNDKKFDYIYSYHVFEHIENPLDLLEFGKKHLKKNGKMIIVCPNVEGFIPRKNILKWRCSILSHRWLPGKSTLIGALTRLGYSIDKVYTYGGYPSPRNVYKNLANYYFKKAGLGDVVCIMASIKN